MHLRLSNSRRTESLILNCAQCRCEAAHLAEDLGELLQQVRPVLAPGLGVDQHQEGDAELRHDAARHASRRHVSRVTCITGPSVSQPSLHQRPVSSRRPRLVSRLTVIGSQLAIDWHGGDLVSLSENRMNIIVKLVCCRCSVDSY